MSFPVTTHTFTYSKVTLRYMSFLLLSLCLSLSLSYILFIAPSSIYQNHISTGSNPVCQNQWQADLLVGFLHVWKFYDWGREQWAQGYISDKISFWLLMYLALFKFSCSAWPLWIARRNLNATFDLNSWVPENVAASAQLRNGCIYSCLGWRISAKKLGPLIDSLANLT